MLSERDICYSLAACREYAADTHETARVAIAHVSDTMCDYAWHLIYDHFTTNNYANIAPILQGRMAGLGVILASTSSGSAMLNSRHALFNGSDSCGLDSEALANGFAPAVSQFCQVVHTSQSLETETHFYTGQ